jgi:hypothetical protein
MTTVTADYALARWAYSELLSAAQKLGYERNGGLPATIWDKKNNGVSFQDLDLRDHGPLAEAWHRVRGNGLIFGDMIAGIANFDVAQWSKDQLAVSYVIPMFAKQATLDGFKPVTFQQWLEAQPLVPLNDPHHAWLPDPDPTSPYQASSDPTLATRINLVTVLEPSKKPYYGIEAYMLLDGYHRAVRFYERGDATDKLTVYVPA